MEVTLHEVELAMELSSADPDGKLPPRLQHALKVGAIKGALTGLEWGAPISFGGPDTYLEVGSSDHADFIH